MLSFTLLFVQGTNRTLCLIRVPVNLNQKHKRQVGSRELNEGVMANTVRYKSLGFTVKNR